MCVSTDIRLIGTEAIRQFNTSNVYFISQGITGLDNTFKI